MHRKIEVADQEPADQSQTAVRLSHPGTTRRGPGISAPLGQGSTDQI
uniref:Uncharacterized protein n=1 Tax=Picea glauca TaxID=3330 RepID=A0A124GMJ3_PICGL|nr:hypothetical protein ABT39_MTgene2215 [Picea glauca]QHR86644.1 hypothetical protein Q903MT_gene647 [Picea sitchensis]